MSLIKCPECGQDVSTNANSCPHCGNPIKDSLAKTIFYDTKVIKIRCWGRGTNSINSKLYPYTSQGWEVVTMVEDRWQGGLLSPVYKVTLRRPRK